MLPICLLVVIFLDLIRYLRGCMAVKGLPKRFKLVETVGLPPFKIQRESTISPKGCLWFGTVIALIIVDHSDSNNDCDDNQSLF